MNFDYLYNRYNTNLLKENPDKVDVNGIRNSWTSKTARPFFLDYDFKWMVDSTRNSHKDMFHSLARHFVNDYSQQLSPKLSIHGDDFKLYQSLKKISREANIVVPDRTETPPKSKTKPSDNKESSPTDIDDDVNYWARSFCYSGRYWTDVKVISFWNRLNVVSKNIEDIIMSMNDLKPGMHFEKYLINTADMGQHDKLLTFDEVSRNESDETMSDEEFRELMKKQHIDPKAKAKLKDSGFYDTNKNKGPHKNTPFRGKGASIFGDSIDPYLTR